MHWVDDLAEKITEEGGDSHVVACGISPSGPIHYGNFREVATAELVHRGLKDHGATSKLVWVSDDFDPLRRVYPFLPDSYEEHVGKPLSEIPDPEGCHPSYSEHFEEPFLDVLPELGIGPVVERASEMYRRGDYDRAIEEALENAGEIAEIIEEVTSRELPRGWTPFNPICEECGRYAGAREGRYECECGNSGETSSARGKLPWRVDWPARWRILGVTVEPFGKDHAASGGSYDTGKRVSSEVFGYDPPHPIVYEQIGLKGEGEMSSSEGVAVTPGKLLEVMEPELVRFVIASTKPWKHIELDIDGGLPRLYEEMDRAESKFREGGGSDEGRAFELSTMAPLQEIDLPFSHAVNAVQVSPDDPLVALTRTEHSDEGERVEGRLRRAANWVSEYAPERFTFEVSEETPRVSLTEEQRELLAELVYLLDEDISSEELQSSIYELGDELGMSTRDAFAAVYEALLGRESGPRAGPFVLSLGRKFVKERFGELSESEGE